MKPLISLLLLASCHLAVADSQAQALGGPNADPDAPVSTTAQKPSIYGDWDSLPEGRKLQIVFSSVMRLEQANLSPEDHKTLQEAYRSPPAPIQQRKEDSQRQMCELFHRQRNGGKGHVDIVRIAAMFEHLQDEYFEGLENHFQSVLDNKLSPRAHRLIENRLGAGFANVKYGRYDTKAVAQENPEQMFSYVANALCPKPAAPPLASTE